MHREVLDAVRIKDRHKGLEGLQVGDGRLQPVAYHLLEEVCPRSKNQHRKRYTSLAELHPFERKGHCEVIRACTLHHACEFHGPVPVGVGLHEHEHPGFRFQKGTEIPVVALCGRELEFET